MMSGGLPKGERQNEERSPGMGKVRSVGDGDARPYPPEASRERHNRIVRPDILATSNGEGIQVKRRIVAKTHRPAKKLTLQDQMILQDHSTVWTMLQGARARGEQCTRESVQKERARPASGRRAVVYKAPGECAGARGREVCTEEACPGTQRAEQPGAASVQTGMGWVDGMYREYVQYVQSV